MSNSPAHFDNQPLRYWKGQPVYLTLYLTAALAIATAILLFLEAGGFPAVVFGFAAPLFFHGALWQPFTYPFLNPLDFFTPLGLWCFYAWGVEVEKYLGRRRFLLLCGALLATPILFATGLYFFGRYGLLVAGDFYLIFGLLIA